MCRLQASSAQGRAERFLGDHGTRQLAGGFPLADGDALDVDYVDYH
jgi:hypothetical protein